MMLEGVVSILEGMNPRMVEIKLSGFLNEPVRQEKDRAA
jgi:flagellar motor component MotA